VTPPLPLNQLERHFKPGFLQRDLTVFQCYFDEGEPFHLTVTADDFEFSAGESPDPTIRLFIDRQETFWQLLSGQQDGMAAFMEGRYRADGNIVLSQLLLYLFKPDDPTIVYEVQD